MSETKDRCDESLGALLATGKHAPARARYFLAGVFGALPAPAALAPWPRSAGTPIVSILRLATETLVESHGDVGRATELVGKQVRHAIGQLQAFDKDEMKKKPTGCCAFDSHAEFINEMAKLSFTSPRSEGTQGTEIMRSDRGRS